MGRVPNGETGTVRVVPKIGYDQQFFFELAVSQLGVLAASSIRIRTTLISLTSNNLSYCAQGTLLHWWDTFPVPTYAPAPYNDAAVYGISPGWGYATVLQSRIDEIPSGAVIWGFLPISSFPVDLQLEGSALVRNHWFETSSHRKALMSIYQRYILVPGAASQLAPTQSSDPGDADPLLAWSTLLLECGYLLNRFTFPHSSVDNAITPFPEAAIPWSAQDADIRSALLISLGASSKTGRQFAHQLATNRTQGSGPVALVEVSSQRESALEGMTVSFVHRAVTYAEVMAPECLQWIAQQLVKKVVVIDFGSRNNVVEHLSAALRSMDHNVVVIAVGGEARVYSQLELVARRERAGRLQSIQYNTSGVRNVAMAQLGQARYFEDMEAEAQRVISSELQRNRGTERDGNVLGISLKCGRGLKGKQGLEGAWERLCGGEMAGNEGLVFKL